MSSFSAVLRALLLFDSVILAIALKLRTLMVLPYNHCLIQVHQRIHTSILQYKFNYRLLQLYHL